MIKTATPEKFDTRGLVSYKIIVEGEDLSSLLSVESFVVEQGVHSITKATIVLIDGNIPKQDFETSNDANMAPGSRIEILTGYDMEDVKIFGGFIIAQQVGLDENGSRLTLYCASDAYQMTKKRQNRIHYDMTDTEIFEFLTSEYEISATAPNTDTTYPALLQNATTDWDFLLARAQRRGLITIDLGEEIVLCQPDLNAEPIQRLIMRDNLLEANLELSSSNMYTHYSSDTWNYTDQEVVEIASSTQSVYKPGNISNTDLAEIYKQNELLLNTKGSYESSEIQALVDAKKLWQELSKITGTIRVQGSHKYTVGSMVTIEGMGNRFDGKHFISSVVHDYNKGNWYATLEIGINPKWLVEKYTNVSELPATGTLPCIHGLQIGIVTALEGSADGEHCIRVQMPMIDSSSEGIWARPLSPYAGSDFGIQFLPEIGSEVLLGFLDDDPSQAIVLGGLYSNTNTAPEKYMDDNFKKIIKTQSGIHITIDDEKKILQIETPSGHLISLNEDDDEIAIKHAQGSIMELSSDGISILSAKDLVLSAKGDINIEGMNIESKAQTSYKAEGQTGTEIKSNANTVIKGTIVQIN